MALQWDVLSRISYWRATQLPVSEFNEPPDIPWNDVVLDQAHGTRHQEPEYPENAKSEAHQGAHKLALTGTPIPNSS
jgi:hypothetical protein